MGIGCRGNPPVVALWDSGLNGVMWGSKKRAGTGTKKRAGTGTKRRAGTGTCPYGNGGMSWGFVIIAMNRIVVLDAGFFSCRTAWLYGQVKIFAKVWWTVLRKRGMAGDPGCSG